MSDYHIKELATDLKTINVVYHVPLGAGNNSVGVPWRTALVNSLGGADAITSVLTDISSAELTEMKAGSIYEAVRTMRFSSVDLTGAERGAEVEVDYSASRTAIGAEMTTKLDFYGKTGDVI